MLSLVDGVLALDVHPNAAGAVERWIPRNARPAEASEGFAARIRVVAAPSEERLPEGARNNNGKPTLTLDGVRLWLRDGQGLMLGSSSAHGAIDTSAGEARISIVAGQAEAADTDVYSMLTIASAALLLHEGCALIHAGAVAAPDGRAWLLVGDTHSGKSTTCLNMIRGGCAYIADDQVVLRPSGEKIVVHGWPRDFHIDKGWERGEREGSRHTIDPLDFTSRVQRDAPLAGILMVSIASNSPTQMVRTAGSDALAGIVRQSPWFLADREVASLGLALLTRAAALPAFALTLGLDVYTDAGRLMDVVSTALDSGAPGAP